jgi:hypothetical protein
VLRLIADEKAVKIDVKKLKLFQHHHPFQDIAYFQTAILKGSRVAWRFSHRFG